jgi:hypothetical protein
MRPLFNIAIFTFSIIISTSCYAQQMVNKTSDTKKLEINKTEFVGKPLKELLKEIGPKIETALGSPSSSEQPGFINFYFTQKKDYDKYRKQNKFPLTLKVYVKGDFDWNKKGKTNEDWLNWTKEDEKKYGELIVLDIKVYNVD